MVWIFWSIRFTPHALAVGTLPIYPGLGPARRCTGLHSFEAGLN